MTSLNRWRSKDVIGPAISVGMIRNSRGPFVSQLSEAEEIGGPQKQYAFRVSEVAIMFGELPFAK